MRVGWTIEYLMNLIQKDSYIKKIRFGVGWLPSMDENHHSRIFEEEIQCGGNEPKAFVVWTSSSS